MEFKLVKLKFGTAKIYDRIIEVVINEAVNFQDEHLESLFELFDIYFHDKKFLYLSNRIHDYSHDLNPKLYKAVHRNLMANAIVCHNSASYKNAIFEKKFYNKTPFEVFRDYDDAVDWLKGHLE